MLSWEGDEPDSALRKNTAENPLTPLIQAKLFAGSNQGTPLAELARQLLEQQKSTWPQLNTGYASLTSVRVREIRCNRFSVWLQFNPGRIVSTDAKVDARSIRDRKCFLCVENLPDPQKGIAYQDEFLILCNPAPIFAEHFTISSIAHTPQALRPNIKIMFDLARDLSPNLTVFYNGPRCGASAPDHMHFQANPTGSIPVEKSAREDAYRIFCRSMGSVEIFTLRDFGRQAIVLESHKREGLTVVVNKILDSLSMVLGAAEEPMINVLCSYTESVWRVIVFPRSKHRPDVFFKNESERVMISPAAVDIGGLIITPREKDFSSVDALFAESMFREVSLSPADVEKTILRLS